MKIQNTEYQRSGTLRRDLGASLQNSCHAIAMHAYIHAYCIGRVCSLLILWSRTMFYHIQYRVQLNTIYKKQSQKKTFVKGKRDFERSYAKKFTLLQCFKEKLTHRWQNEMLEISANDDDERKDVTSLENINVALCSPLKRLVTIRSQPHDISHRWMNCIVPSVSGPLKEVFESQVKVQ